MSRAVKASKELVDSAIGAGETAAKSAEVVFPGMNAAVQTAKNYQAAQTATTNLQSNAKTTETAAVLKQALGEADFRKIELSKVYRQNDI